MEFKHLKADEVAALKAAAVSDEVLEAVEAAEYFTDWQRRGEAARAKLAEIRDKK